MYYKVHVPPAGGSQAKGSSPDPHPLPSLQGDKCIAEANTTLSKYVKVNMSVEKSQSFFPVVAI